MAQSQYPMTRGTSGPSTMPTSWNEMFRRFGFPSFFERTLSMGIPAPVDVCERDNDFVIRMGCAGCRPQDLDVTVENDVVHIRGKFMNHEQAEQGKEHETCLIRELPSGRFERDITLPTGVNANQAHASFENGMLTLTLPKSAAAQGHKIPIGQGAAAGSR